MDKISICHLTSAHERTDVRIFHKMCSSLAKSNFNVNLVVADGLNNEFKDNISIFDVGKRKQRRIDRMSKTVDSVYEKAIELNSDLYHLHDPELIRIGLKLKKEGKIVIFDAHEDLPKQILGKPYLNIFSKYILYFVATVYEMFQCRKFNLIITATSKIKDKFSNINKSIDINNYPLIEELTSLQEQDITNKYDEIVYVGAISRIRGIIPLVKALEFLPEIKLNLIGKFNEDALEKEVKELEGWKQVNFFGFLNRDEALSIMKKSKIGIVTFLDVPNHVESQPNKMFEYMSQSLPIITSNFELWKEIVEGNNCGICVNPEKPNEIANAVNFILKDKENLITYGNNAYNAVKNTYNWKVEEVKLIKKYKEIINENFNNFRS